MPQLQKASHAASKSLLFSFVLDTFQAISVFFFLTVQAQEEEYQTSGCVGEENLLFLHVTNAVEFTSHFKTLYTTTQHSNANVDLKYFCFL